jgi:hypothetical protein
MPEHTQNRQLLAPFAARAARPDSACTSTHYFVQGTLAVSPRCAITPCPITSANLGNRPSNLPVPENPTLHFPSNPGRCKNRLSRKKSFPSSLPPRSPEAVFRTAPRKAGDCSHEPIGGGSNKPCLRKVAILFLVQLAGWGRRGTQSAPHQRLSRSEAREQRLCWAAFPAVWPV